MSLTFLLSDRDQLQIGKENLCKLAETYTLLYPQRDFQVEVELVSLLRITELNTVYRSLAEPTDVLSFPLFESLTDILSQTQPPSLLIGSIVISPEKTEMYNETLIQMVHHGLLHLFGYDHETDYPSWHAAEERILSKLEQVNLSIPILTV